MPCFRGNIRTLKGHLESEFQSVFPNTERKVMIKHCLENLSGTAGEFAAVTRKGLHLLCNTIFVRVRPLIDAFFSTSMLPARCC